MKKLIAILCSISLCVTTAVPAFAADVTATAPVKTIHYTSETYVNPLYPSDLDKKDAGESDIAMPFSHSSKKLLASATSTDYAQSIEEAGEILREQMTKRASTAVVPLHITSTVEPAYQLLLEQIFEEALQHTGNSNEGDALMWAWKTWDCSIGGSGFGNDLYLVLTYSLEFYTTPQQEAELLDSISVLKNELQIDNATDLLKIQTIYSYICENVDYDYANLPNTAYDLKYTDYAALIHGTSVCQGYALLFYRLALEYDIDARLIAGDANGGPHAWNIVKIGDLYYYLDATWDAEWDPDAYYLKGSDSFSSEHFPSEEYLPAALASKHPISKTDFDGTIHTHDLEISTKVAASCKNEGLQNISCSGCIYKTEKSIAKLPHTPGDAATCTTSQLCTVCKTTLASATGHTEEILAGKAATCTEDGLTEGKKCKTCGIVTTKQTTVPAKGHTDETLFGYAATCTTSGLTDGKVCAVCQEEMIKQEIIPAKGHAYGSDYICDSCGFENANLNPTPEISPTPDTSEPSVHAHYYETIVTPATTKIAGSIIEKCACGEVKSSKTIAKIKTIKLSKDAFVYTGKVKSPTIIIKDANGKIIGKKHYTVTTSKGRKNVGKYTYTIKFKGDYSGKRKLTLTIKPAKPTIKAPKSAKKAITVKWKKVSKQATGYQVMVATNKSFTKNVKKAFVKNSKTTSKKMTKLKAKTKYFVKVRTYKTVKGVKIYSDWSKVKTIRSK